VVVVVALMLQLEIPTAGMAFGRSDEEGGREEGRKAEGWSLSIQALPSLLMINGSVIASLHPSLPPSIHTSLTFLPPEQHEQQKPQSNT